MARRWSLTIRLSELTRSAFVVAGGTVAGQVTLLLTSIITARLFSPAEFGLLATVTAVSVTLYVVCTGRYDFAILTAPGHRDAIHLARLALSVAAVSSALLGMCSLLARDVQSGAWIQPVLSHWWAVPALTFSTAAFQIGNQIAVRSQRYRSLALRALVFPLIAGGLQVLAGLRGFGGEALVLGVILGQLVALAFVWAPIMRTLGQGERTPVAPRRMIMIAREYWKFPALSAPAGLVNMMSSQLPVLIITALYGISAGGQYGVATKLLAAPVALLGQTVGYVYAGEVARRARERNQLVLPLLRTASLRLVALGIVLLAVVVIGAPFAVELLLGSTWQRAGQYMQLMALGVVGQMIVAPISQTLTIARMQGSQLMLDLVRLGLIVGCIPAAWRFDWDDVTTVAALSLAGAAGYALMAGANFLAAHRLDARSVEPLSST